MMKIFQYIFIYSTLLFSLHSQPINAITRESGSGTRSAFIDIFDIKSINNQGKKIDAIDPKIQITNSAAIIILTTMQNPNAIGYISLASLNPKIKALKIDDIYPSIENIKNKSYPITRPFNLVFKSHQNEALKDFLCFLKSKEASKIIDKKGYVSLSHQNYIKRNIQGKLTISGSSSISPLMQSLIEAYQHLNPQIKILLQQNDSTIGLNNLQKNLSDLAMVSRNIKPNEIDSSYEVFLLAQDAIIMIVNPKNPIQNLSKDKVKSIYLGQINTWDFQ